ncbi:hypothetical protein B0T14DRAFT_569186 [Immersiella caudata]|uniref:Uncharacterized protein n=1 Tax=Immersiella caudata TaxID=314043 RepID=A0AA39WLP4_9PEZI|nr:hypothetical protein B0T14DRAFT_569186 [Immersiella caudata]
MSRLDPNYYYTISLFPTNDPIQLLSIYPDPQQLSIVPGPVSREPAPTQLWKFVLIPGPMPIYIILSQELGTEMVLAINSGSGIVEMAKRHDGQDDQKWEVSLIGGDGDAPHYQLTNLDAGLGLSLETGDEGKVVPGKEGVEEITWVLKKVSEVEQLGE